MVSEGEPSTPPENNLNAIHDSEIQPLALSEQRQALANQEKPDLLVHPTLSGSSPYKFDLFKDPADLMGELKENGTASKFLSDSSSRSIEIME